jgi:hypothetical protein
MISVNQLLRSLQMLAMTEQAVAIARNSRPNDVPVKIGPASVDRGRITVEAMIGADFAAVVDPELQGPSLAGLRPPLQGLPAPELPYLLDLPDLDAAPRAAQFATAARDGGTALAAADDLLPARVIDATVATSRTLAGTSFANPAGALEALTQMLADPALQAERAGILSSCILNAAMIPSWPRNGPQAADSDAALARGGMTPDPVMTEAEILTYLANLGVAPDIIEELRKRHAKPPRGRKILLFFATLFTAVGMVIDTLRREIADLIAEQGDHEERRQRADTPEDECGRHRIYIE